MQKDFSNLKVATYNPTNYKLNSFYKKGLISLMVSSMRERKKQGLPVLAVDIGGTKIITAIISNKGWIIAKKYPLALAEQGLVR